MEIWDVLDEHGNHTGRTMVRGEKMNPGEYYLAVHIWIKNSEGQYLIQKRSEEKTLWPGVWAVTGGAVVSGETSLQAAMREVEEELGVRPQGNSMCFLTRIKRKDWFTDLWLLQQDIEIADITMQPGEVDDVRWSTADAINDMVKRKEFVAYNYLDAFFDGRIMVEK